MPVQRGSDSGSDSLELDAENAPAAGLLLKKLPLPPPTVGVRAVLAVRLQAGTSCWSCS